MVLHNVPAVLSIIELSDVCIIKRQVIANQLTDVWKNVYPLSWSRDPIKVEDLLIIEISLHNISMF